MTTIKLIIKGFFIGMGKIIPGVSGAVLAIIFNLYDEGLNAITSFFNDVKKNIFFLLKIGIGIVIAILCFSNIIIYLLNNYYFLTMMFFIGLIMGGIREIIKKLNHNKTNYLCIMCSFISLFILTIITISNQFKINNNFFTFFISGLLDAFSTIIPGISGTSLLMLLGTYTDVILSIGNLWKVELFKQNIQTVIPFLLGLFGGIIIFAKMMNNLFQKHYQKTMSLVLGLSLATGISLIIQTVNRSYNVLNLVLGIILFILGIIISNKLSE